MPGALVGDGSSCLRLRCSCRYFSRSSISWLVITFSWRFAMSDTFPKVYVGDFIMLSLIMTLDWCLFECALLPVLSVRWSAYLFSNSSLFCLLSAVSSLRVVFIRSFTEPMGQSSRAYFYLAKCLVTGDAVITDDCMFFDSTLPWGLSSSEYCSVPTSFSYTVPILWAFRIINPCSVLTRLSGLYRAEDPGFARWWGAGLTSEL